METNQSGVPCYSFLLYDQKFFKKAGIKIIANFLKENLALVIIY